jgi:hypothetical protein
VPAVCNPALPIARARSAPHINAIAAPTMTLRAATRSIRDRDPVQSIMLVSA